MLFWRWWSFGQLERMCSTSVDSSIHHLNLNLRLILVWCIHSLLLLAWSYLQFALGVVSSLLFSIFIDWSFFLNFHYVLPIWKFFAGVLSMISYSRVGNVWGRGTVVVLVCLFTFWTLRKTHFGVIFITEAV